MLTLTRAEAHALVDAAEQLGALDQLAEGWDLAGWWNCRADWDVTDFHEHIENCCLTDDVRSRGPRDDDDSGLPDCDLL